MKELEIEDSQDWHRVKHNLRVMCFQFPQFLHDYDRIVSNIEIKIKELCDLEIQVRRHNTLWHRQVRDNKIKEINNTIKTFSKILLVATLAKR